MNSNEGAIALNNSSISMPKTKEKKKVVMKAIKSKMAKAKLNLIYTELNDIGINIDREYESIDELKKDLKSKISELADSSIKYQIKVYCNPIDKIQIRRDSLRCVLLGLDKHNISVPYNQIDVHQK